MPLAFIDDFDRRRRQVRRYLATVASIERKTAASSKLFDIDRLHILRAGAFLILYNLVEASARAAIEGIHDEMTTARVAFADLSPAIRREVVKGFKRNAKPDTHLSMVDLPVEFVSVALDADHHFSGNVDAKLIRTIGAAYGFSCDTEPATTRAGADLLLVKDTRNDLAHGRKTYDEVGRIHSSRDLIAISYRSMNYVAEILRNVSAYLEKEAYLAESAPLPAGQFEATVT